MSSYFDENTPEIPQNDENIEYIIKKLKYCLSQLKYVIDEYRYTTSLDEDIKCYKFFKLLLQKFKKEKLTGESSKHSLIISENKELIDSIETQKTNINIYKSKQLEWLTIFKEDLDKLLEPNNSKLVKTPFDLMETLKSNSFGNMVEHPVEWNYVVYFLNKLSKYISDNNLPICIAGGFAQWLKNPSSLFNDIDLFIYKTDDKIKIIKDLCDFLSNIEYPCKTLIIMNKAVIDVHINNSQSDLVWYKDDGSIDLIKTKIRDNLIDWTYGMDNSPKLQIILKDFNSIEEVLNSFDIPVCCVAYNFHTKELITTDLSEFCIENKIIPLLTNKVGSSYCYRVEKYWNRDYKIITRFSKYLPKEIFDRSYNKKKYQDYLEGKDPQVNESSQKIYEFVQELNTFLYYTETNDDGNYKLVELSNVDIKVNPETSIKNLDDLLSKYLYNPKKKEFTTFLASSIYIEFKDMNVDKAIHRIIPDSFIERAISKVNYNTKYITPQEFFGDYYQEDNPLLYNPISYSSRNKKFIV
jgi:hypothetical protein